MPAIDLRPYQEEAVAAVEREWGEGRPRTLCVLATGTGKTRVASEIVRRDAVHGGTALWVAHRGELLDQATEAIHSLTGLAVAREQASESAAGGIEAVVVASAQTLARPERLEGLDPSRFDLVVVDEAHHATSETYRRILGEFGHARVLGLTATPDRADGSDLGAVFDSIAKEYGIADAVRDGWLCPIEAETVPLQIDISEVSQSNGDYAAGQLGDALEPYLDAIADVMAERDCGAMRTVAFLPLVATAERLAGKLRARGVAAEEVHGTSPDRAEIIARFKSGETGVLCNSMLLTEGWDCPEVSCVVVLRPTRSRPLYAQMVGRGTRMAPGKEGLLLLDFLWQTDRHDLCRPACLLADREDVVEKATELLARAGGPMDLEEVVDEGERDAMADREAALAKELAAMRKRKGKLVDPLQFAVSIGSEDLTGYVPEFAWERERPRQGDLEQLERAGINPDGITTRWQAERLLGEIHRRRSEGMATPKQVRMLERKGFHHPGQWTFEQADRMMSILANNHWRVPFQIDPMTYDPNEEAA